MTSLRCLVSGPPASHSLATLQLDQGKSSKIFQFHVVKIRNISLCIGTGHIWSLEFGHKSNKIILNKKPSNFEHIFSIDSFKVINLDIVIVIHFSIQNCKIQQVLSNTDKTAQ